MERLTEADDSEGAEGPGKVLSSQLEPVGVADSFLLGSPLGLSQHFRIRVESNDALEEMGEEQSDGPRPAPDIEEAPATIETEVFGEGVGQARSVGFAALPVVGRRTLEHGFVPDPVFPRVARLRHVFSVAGRHGDRPRRSAGLLHLNGVDHVTALETETLAPPLGTLAAPTCFDMGIISC